VTSRSWTTDSGSAGIANGSGLTGLIDGNEHRGAACELAVVTFPEAC
jgi:hypothetical protein